MKNLYSTVLMVLSAGLLCAQTQNTTEVSSPDELASPATHQSVKPYDTRGGSVIWSEDFANGFPSTWAIDDASGICPWVYSMDGTWGNFNGNGATAAAAPINSTTAANGFLICDPDSANHFTYGQPSGTTYQYLDSYFATDAVDCSGFPAVKLEFEQFFRLNNTVDLVVQISSDSVNWTNYNVQGTASNNTASPDPDYVSINISAVAGNQATVYIKIGWSARVYFWMIDDMRIVEAPTDDMSLDAALFDADIEYHQYPIAQVQPLNFSGFLSNEGANTQTNVQMQVDVLDAGSNSVFSGTSAPVDFAMGDTATAYVSAAFTPTALGAYDMHWTATQNESDLFPSNDSASNFFAVTSYTYARDNDIYQSQYWNGDDGNGNSNSYEYGTMYEIMEDYTVESVSIYIGGNTAPGALAYAVLYDYDAGNFAYLNQTNDYTIAAGDLDGWITFSFSTPEPVFAGSSYVVLLGHYGGPDYVYVGRSSRTSPQQTSFLYDGPGSEWFYTTACPMVRMNMGPPDAIEETTADFGMSVYPNPSEGMNTVEFALPQTASVTVQVFDIAGKQVYTENYGSLGAGSYTNVLNLEALANGAYTVRLTVGEQAQSTMLVIGQ
jgi:hypothetical protein